MLESFAQVSMDTGSIKALLFFEIALAYGFINPVITIVAWICIRCSLSVHFNVAQSVGIRLKVRPSEAKPPVNDCEFAVWFQGVFFLWFFVETQLKAWWFPVVTILALFVVRVVVYFLGRSRRKQRAQVQPRAREPFISRESDLEERHLNQ